MTKNELLKNLKIDLDYILVCKDINLKSSTYDYYLRVIVEDIEKYFKISKIESVFIKYNERVEHPDLIDGETIIEHKIIIMINFGYIKIDTYFLE